MEVCTWSASEISERADGCNRWILPRSIRLSISRSCTSNPTALTARTITGCFVHVRREEGKRNKIDVVTVATVARFSGMQPRGCVNCQCQTSQQNASANGRNKGLLAPSTFQNDQVGCARFTLYHARIVMPNMRKTHAPDGQIAVHTNPSDVYGTCLLLEEDNFKPSSGNAEVLH